MGERAMHYYLPETASNSINEMRGSPFLKNGIVFIPCFHAQDAADMKAYEQQLNPLSDNYQPDASEYDDSDDEGDVKVLGKTARKNYAFWLRADVRKAKRILANDGKIPCLKQEPEYRLHSNSEEIIKVLTETKGQFLYFDMETDYEEQNMQCFGFSFGSGPIYCVTTLDYNYRPAPNVHRIMRALAVAIRDNTIVAHNGQTFDFFVLGHKYSIPVVDCYDTLIAQHRIFPGVEKSLGHCVSYWTYEKFHKDEDSHGYMTREQQFARMKYCAKDVYTMYLVHQAQTEYARTIPGLTESIERANSSIVPYLLATLQGVGYNKALVEQICSENDRLMMQYIRMAKILIGEKGLRSIADDLTGKSKTSFLSSGKQQISYFHNLLGYPVVARSKRTSMPSLGKQAIYKLALRVDNPVLQLIMMFRSVQKETSKLRFTPWKDETNKKAMEVASDKNALLSKQVQDRDGQSAVVPTTPSA